MKRAEKILETLKKSHGNTMLGRIRKDPFRILITTVLSARAKDETTEPISEILFKRYPDTKALMNAKAKEVERIIKPIGFYKVKARRIIQLASEIDKIGRVPQNMDSLIALPGVGRKTAGCVLVYAFDKPAIPVDTHVHRISNRLGLVKTKMPEQTEQELVKIFPKSQWKFVNDLFVYHGKNICKPITPLCSKCAVNGLCEHYKNIKRTG